MTKNEYDIAILGGGLAGISAARVAVEGGARVCLIEKTPLEGACYAEAFLPPWNTLPILNPDEPLSLASLRRYAKDAAENAMASLAEAGVIIETGKGSLINATQVRVEDESGDRFISAGKIIIAVGSRGKSLANFPFDGKNIISSDEIYRLDEIPDSVLVVSGEKTGVETASLLKRFGGKVLICHEQPRLLPEEDPELSIALEEGMKQEKIKLLLGRKVQSILKEPDKINITLDGNVKFSAQMIVFAGQRQGNSAGPGMDAMGIRLGDNEEIWVNEKMETTLDGVYAVGSVTGRSRSYLLSEEEGRVAALCAMGKAASINPRHVPLIIHARPEVASVGCHAASAHEFGFRGIEGRLDLSPVYSSVNGFIKVTADKRTGKVIGSQIVGCSASESIAFAALAVKKGFSVKTLAQMSCGWSSPGRWIQEAARSCLMAFKNET